MNFLINTFFAKRGIPALGLSPTIRIWDVSSSTKTLVITDEAMGETGDGFYYYDFTAALGYDSSKQYVVRADGTTELRNSERYSTGSTQEVSVDETTINTISDDVWNSQSSNHIGSGTMGLLQNTTAADAAQIRIDTVIMTDLLRLLLKYEANKTMIDKTAKTLTVFDDDGITPIKVFKLKDSNGLESVAEVCIREPV